MSTFDFFPKEIWLQILEGLITLPIEFLNPKHRHVRAVTEKWTQGVFKMTYPFLRMVSHDFKQIMDDLKTKYFTPNNPYKPLKGFDMCIAMAAEGHLSALKYLHENGAKWTEDTCNYAALHGHLNCLIYAHESGCKWGTETCALAALNGHFSCLKYAHDNGCAWDDECCSNAAQRGDLSMIQYLVSNKCSWSAQTTERAAKYSQLELLKYLYDSGCPKNQSNIAQAACFSGKIEILKYVREKGCIYSPYLSKIATSVNSLECLQYLHEDGCSWDLDVIYSGIHNDSRECVQYALDNGCPHDEKTIQAAVGYGNIHVLRQLDQRDPNYHYPPRLLFSAIDLNSVECLKFLIEEKLVPVTDKDDLLMRAEITDKLACAEYLRQLDPRYEAPQQQQLFYF